MTAVLLAVSAGFGCASKGDVQSLQEEVSSLAARQARALADFERIVLASQDTLSDQSGLFMQMRGDILQELNLIQDRLVAIEELQGQSRRALAALRDQIEMLQRAPQVVSDADQVAAAGSPEESEGPEALFQQTRLVYERGSNVTARRGFDLFLATYPNHDLAGDATFLLSDIDVQEGRVEEAIDGFMRVPRMYPASARVPEALYRAAILHEELGDTEEARSLLERVVNGFPDSGVAEQAEARLRELP